MFINGSAFGNKQLVRLDQLSLFMIKYNTVQTAEFSVASLPLAPFYKCIKFVLCIQEFGSYTALSSLSRTIYCDLWSLDSLDLRSRYIYIYMSRLLCRRGYAPKFI